jgi:hypothetical protein
MEIILTGMGYSGHNTCVVFREGGKFFCKCIDRDKRAECDVSQLCGDIYGACCPLCYKPEEELEHLLKKIKI